MQKCQKLLANLGSEDTVGRPKNYQAKVPGTVSRTNLQVYTHVTGVPRPSAHNAARSPDPRKLLARPLQSKPRGLRRRLTCNGATVGYMAREQVTTVPRRQARGDMLPAHQLQGELAISVPRHRHPNRVFRLMQLLHSTTFLNILYCPRL